VRGKCCQLNRIAEFSAEGTSPSREYVECFEASEGLSAVGCAVEARITATLFKRGHGLPGTPNWSSTGLVTAVEFKAVRGSALVIL
jgi:hypothetical protein